MVTVGRPLPAAPCTDPGVRCLRTGLLPWVLVSPPGVRDKLSNLTFRAGVGNEPFDTQGQIQGF